MFFSTLDFNGQPFSGPNKSSLPLDLELWYYNLVSLSILRELGLKMWVISNSMIYHMSYAMPCDRVNVVCWVIDKNHLLELLDLFAYHWMVNHFLVMRDCWPICLPSQNVKSNTIIASFLRHSWMVLLFYMNLCRRECILPQKRNKLQE